MHYDYVPKRLIKGELFFIRIKTLSTLQNHKIQYTFHNGFNLEPLNEQNPLRKKEGKFYYDTFYFKATGLHVRLPDIEANIITYAQEQYAPSILEGKNIETIQLNPKKDFCNVIARSFELTRYKTTTYDEEHNIVIFEATAKQTFLSDFHLNNTLSQGFESLRDTIENSKMTYFAVIDKKEENLVFSYFNTLKNKYITLSIPIIVQEDKVTTQSDLKPQDQSKAKIKLLITATIVAIALALLIWRKKYVYAIFVIFPAAYIIIALLPTQQICIKKGTKIHILPLEKSTIFEVTDKKIYLNKIGSTKECIKVELENEKIGWVKNENTCSN
jgi:arsenate reductase-like glutaredoxin family protein